MTEQYKQYVHLIQQQSPYSVAAPMFSILAKRIGCPHHCISGTRWSSRVESAKPFVDHLPGVKLALEDLLDQNRTPDTMSEIYGAMCQVCSFSQLYHDASRVVQNTGPY